MIIGQMNEDDLNLRNVTIIIPVYNGLQVFKDLVKSIAKQYPEPHCWLRFIIIDDASPDEGIRFFLEENIFFKRPDVLIDYNKKNIGFVRSINSGIKKAGFDSDIIILNSDTLIYGPVFETLIKTSIRIGKFGSITPFTNKGSIASLCNWPDGCDNILDLPPSVIAETIFKLNIKCDEIELPSGVGFCMYMSRAAIDDIGVFDDVTFGQGYGEENDWCQRALKAGYPNFLCTQAFVFHQETQSFTAESKQQLAEKNLKKLNKLHKNYSLDVAKFIANDPLQAFRFQVIWALSGIRANRNRIPTVMYVLHSDPWCFYGGTEHHVLDLTKLLFHKGDYNIIYINPYEEGSNIRWGLNFLNKTIKKPLASVLLDSEEVVCFLKTAGNSVDLLHIHHLKRWPESIISLLVEYTKGKKIISLHDNLPLCSNEFLLTDNNSRYCNVEENENICNDCYLKEQGGKCKTIKEYRLSWIKRLEQFDYILHPSKSAQRILLTGLSLWGMKNNLSSHSRVFANPVLLEHTDIVDVDTDKEERIVFLGSIGIHKGSHQIKEAAKILRKRGFTVEIWGVMSDADDLVVRKFRSKTEFAKLARQYPPRLIALPSICPETFSFTMYEALALLKIPVVVGRYGHPAEFVSENNCGTVIMGNGADALVDAISLCFKHYDSYLKEAVRISAEIISRSSIEYNAELLMLLYKPETWKTGQHKFNIEKDALDIAYNPERASVASASLEKRQLLNFYNKVKNVKGMRGMVIRFILFGLYRFSFFQKPLRRTFKFLKRFNS